MWYRYSANVYKNSANEIVLVMNVSEAASKASLIQQITGIDINSPGFKNQQSKPTPGISSKKAKYFNWAKYASDPIEKMRQINSQSNPHLEEAKNIFIENVSDLNPVEHSENLKEHWKNYTDKLATESHLPNLNFPSYEEWKMNYPDEEVKRLFIEHKGPKAADDFDPEKKSRELYNAQKDLDLLNRDFGMASEEANPFAAFSDLRKIWSQKVAEHHKESIPSGSGIDQKVSLISGYPGAGKSTLIEPNRTSQDPIRSTKYGILVDPDEYQKDLIGYANGAGSERTMIYSNSIVKPEILKEALAKGNDVVIPFVGGSVDAILNEAINHILKDLKVDVIFVPTDAKTSHKRSIERAKNGGRLIAPYTTGDPSSAFLDAQKIIQNPDYDLPDLFTKKLLTKLGYTPAQIKKLSYDQKSEIHDRYANLLNFDIAAP